MYKDQEKSAENKYLEAKIRRRMVHSKKGLSTISWMTERKKFHFVMSQEPSQQEQHLGKGCVKGVGTTPGGQKANYPGPEQQ